MYHDTQGSHNPGFLCLVPWLQVRRVLLWWVFWRYEFINVRVKVPQCLQFCYQVPEYLKKQCTKIANIATVRFLNMLRPPNFQGTLLVSIPTDSDHFYLNSKSYRKMFILFISFITGTRALIFGHTGHYSLAIVSHYTTKPILTEFGPNYGSTKHDIILLQVFANFLDTLGPSNKIANIAP